MHNFEQFDFFWKKCQCSNKFTGLGLISMGISLMQEQVLGKIDWAVGEMGLGAKNEKEDNEKMKIIDGKKMHKAYTIKRQCTCRSCLEEVAKQLGIDVKTVQTKNLDDFNQGNG